MFSIILPTAIHFDHQFSQVEKIDRLAAEVVYFSICSRVNRTKQQGVHHIIHIIQVSNLHPIAEYLNILPFQ